MTRKRISKQNRLKLYKRFNGHCAYCGCKILFEEMEIDHSVPIAKTNNENSAHFISSNYNLRPTCHDCNNFKNSMSAGEFKFYLEEKLMKELKKVLPYRIALKYGFIQQLFEQKDVSFYINEHLEEIYPEDD